MLGVSTFPKPDVTLLIAGFLLFWQAPSFADQVHSFSIPIRCGEDFYNRVLVPGYDGSGGELQQAILRIQANYRWTIGVELMNRLDQDVAHIARNQKIGPQELLVGHTYFRYATRITGIFSRTEQMDLVPSGANQMIPLATALSPDGVVDFGGTGGTRHIVEGNSPWHEYVIADQGDLAQFSTSSVFVGIREREFYFRGGRVYQKQHDAILNKPITRLAGPHTTNGFVCTGGTGTLRYVY